MGRTDADWRRSTATEPRDRSERGAAASERATNGASWTRLLTLTPAREHSDRASRPERAWRSRERESDERRVVDESPDADTSEGAQRPSLANGASVAQQRARERVGGPGGAKPPGLRIGAPSTTRTCDLLVRSGKKGVYPGQRDTAAPMFSGFFDRWRLPENTSSRDGLSAVCQSRAPAHGDRSAATVGSTARL